MAKKGTLRKVTFEQSKEEDRDYFLNLSYADRLRELERLRRLNYGDAVLQPMKKNNYSYFKK